MNEITLTPEEVIQRLNASIQQQEQHIESLRQIKSRTAILAVAEQIQQLIFNAEDTLLALNNQKAKIAELVGEKEIAAASAPNEVQEPVEDTEVI